jgi:Ni/Co efflux regulator RcnB
MLRTLLLSLSLLAAPVLALDQPPWKEDQKARKEQHKAERDWHKAQRKQDREWIKQQRSRQKALRKQQGALATDGWYDGRGWNDHAEALHYRDQHWEAVARYPAPRDYLPPADFEVIVYEPGMPLPQPWIRNEYIVEHRPYGLPPPPPGHHWMQVDDDVVLVALASGLIADFVYDLFEQH